MMHISESMFFEIILGSETKMINRPNARRRFGPNEMLICGVPSEDGSVFGYFICQNFFDIAGIPERFVTWFIAKKFCRTDKIVVVGPANPVVYRMVNDIRPGLDLVRRAVLELLDNGSCDSGNDEMLLPLKPAKDLSERNYWKLQQNHRPDPRCRIRGRRRKQY